MLTSQSHILKLYTASLTYVTRTIYARLYEVPRMLGRATQYCPNWESATFPSSLSHNLSVSRSSVSLHVFFLVRLQLFSGPLPKQRLWICLQCRRYPLTTFSEQGLIKRLYSNAPASCCLWTPKLAIYWSQSQSTKKLKQVMGIFRSFSFFEFSD